MFSKAIYDPAKSCAVEGLVETSIPGRYTPRKLAAARAAPAVQQSDQRSGAASTPALSTAFRVVPNELGKFCPRRGNGGSVAPGIAPAKRLCESQSAPALKRDPQGTRQSGASSPGRAALSPVSGGGGDGGSNATAGSVGSREVTARSMLSEKLQASGASTVNDDRSVLLAGGGRRTSRGLSRCGSDFATPIGHGTTEGRSDANAGLMKKSASVSCLASTGRGGSSARSLGSACWSRGVTPAQRRVADQIALDFATVRSLVA